MHAAPAATPAVPGAVHVVPVVGGGEPAATHANNTVSISWPTSISIPGGSIAAFTLNYVYRGGGLWSTSVGSQRTLQHDGTRWVAKYVDALNGNYPQLWAAGAANADPSALSWAHAAAPYNYNNYGGTFSASATSGYFAGTGLTAPGAIHASPSAAPFAPGGIHTVPAAAPSTPPAITP